MTIVKKEGYSAGISLLDGRRIWPGERNFLMTGDAAGLIDVTRGVGMDAAALSGRLAAKGIGIAARAGRPAGETYARLMQGLIAQTRKNLHSGVLSCATNAALQAYLDRGMLRTGLRMLIQNRLNRFRNGEQQVMLP